MQKSRKLMVSLCGLALSSLFVVNSKSVVHADAVNDANNQNNNAISWDSDSDAAQQVQNDSEQSSVQNTQVADDHQQNQVSNVQSYAETSTVRSSSEAPRITNQNAAVQSPHVANVQDAQASNPIVINNPAGDKINVHYVNHDGGAITDPNVKDTTIDVTKTGQGSYQVPNGYSLNNPDGNYNVSGGKFGAATLKGSVEHHEASVNYGLGEASLDELDPSLNKMLLTHANDLKAGNSWYLIMRGEWDKTFQDFCDNYFDHSYVINQLPMGNPSIENDDIATEFYGNGSHDEQTLNKVMAKMRSFYNEQPNVAKFIPADPKDRFSAAQLYEPLTLLSKTEAYDEQHLPVAFVDSNNNLVGMIQNYSGKVGTTQNVSLTVPTGYKLANGETFPTSVTFANNTNAKFIKVVSNGQTNSVQNPVNNTINVNFVDQETHKSVGTAAIDLTKQQQGTNYYQTPNGWATDNNGRYDVGTPFSRGYLTITDDKGNNAQQLILNAKQAQDFFEAFRKGHDTDLSIQAYLPAIHPDEINLQDLAYNGVSTYDKENGDRSWENIVYNATKKVIQTETNRHMTDNYGQGVFDGYYGKITAKRYNAYTFTDNYHPYDASTNTVTVPVHKTSSFSFADNTDNVQSVRGNTVDVVLTKPQSVNPATDTRCQSQATRVIHVNFPDGQIPVSYKDIVDSHGNLKQTVHFTRTATEDALTGNILQYGNWTSDNQDHNFIGFPERTLPRIPGYTLSIKSF